MSDYAATPFRLRVGALSPFFSGDPQEFLAELVRLSEIVGPSGFYGIVVSDTEPTSNEGLWLKDGSRPYVWDEDSSGYVPMDLTDSLTAVLAAITALQAKLASGRLILSETEPTGADASPEVLWGQLDSDGYLAGLWNYIPSVGWKLRQSIPAVIFGETTGAAGAFEFAGEPPMTGYVPFRIYVLRANHDPHGPASISVDGLPFRQIVLGPTTLLSDGQLLENQIMVLVDDGTRMQLLNPSPKVTSGSADVGTLAAMLVFDGSSALTTVDTIASTSADTTFTKAGHGLTQGSVFWATGGTSIPVEVPYYVHVVDTDNFKLAASLAELASSTFIPAVGTGSFDGYTWDAVITSVGIDGVIRLGAGRYVIDFTDAEPNPNYAVLATPMRANPYEDLTAMLENSANYPSDEDRFAMVVFQSDDAPVDTERLSVVVYRG